MKKYAEIHSEKQIVQAYREGMTVTWLTQSLYYQRKADDKKITLKQCKTDVEHAILDYLLSL
jgi:hypothetical protein